ncbi:MAG TPA: hypothetical protein VHB70_03450 [Parafilimonas sp.]|nr:hypothetical protein [Parafilimonas sp.]
MTDATSFNIKVNELSYIVKPQQLVGSTLYEVFTNCEKLFTLKRNNEGRWVTNEDDIIPLYETLVEDIGEALNQYEYQYK